MKDYKEKNGYKHCKPEQLWLDGKYTKILKAFADANGLQHTIEWSNTNFGLGLEVSVQVKNKHMESILDVFKHGRVAYVSNMREYTQDANPSIVEDFNKKIVDEMCGDGLYLKSFKGGDCLGLIDGKWQLIPRYELECPSSFDELLIQIDLAGIDWQKSEVHLQKSTI